MKKITTKATIKKTCGAASLHTLLFFLQENGNEKENKI
jgi:hypothetical protein